LKEISHRSNKLKSLLIFYHLNLEFTMSGIHKVVPHFNWLF
jgi:hypothetical protein